MVTFVFCVEPGRLEGEARLLVESIRRFGGRLDQAPIYAIQPRNVDPLQPDTLSLFERADVTHRAGYLNTSHAAWPTTNKVYAIAEVERIVATPFLVFLDTDSVILNEPSECLLAEGSDLAVQPTVKQLRGSTGPDDPNDRFWQTIYRVCNVPEPQYVTTMIDQVTMRGYYNGGLVVLRRAAALGRRWLEFLDRIGPLMAPDSRYNLDQVSLAAVAASVPGRVKTLPVEYNYNIARREQFISERVRGIALDELVHIHYHQAFRRAGFLSAVRPPLDQTDERYRWLAERLPLEAGFEVQSPQLEAKTEAALRDLPAAVTGDTFLLVDDEVWRTRLFGTSARPFLERQCQPWGAPSDDNEAIDELDKAASAGARYLVFAWPGTWWLEHYRVFADYLHSTYTCVRDSGLVIVFDLTRNRRARSPAGAPR